MNGRFSSLVYEIASSIDGGVGETGLGWLDWDDVSFREDILRFGRSSIVKKVTGAFLTEEFRRDLSKNPADWIETGRLESLESDFRFYGIKIQKFSAYCRRIRARDVDTEQEALETWWDVHEEAFGTLYERYSREVEHLLFSNRHFLLRLHLALAALLKAEAPRLLGCAVPLPRIGIPRWVKRAAYCRDRGRCIFCNVDLSGTINWMTEEHFDHMVPLAIGGANDVSNIQLSCKACNLRKSRKPGTKYRYAEWWDEG